MEDFSAFEIRDTLTRLNIKHVVERDRISLICPFHADRNLGSAFIRFSDGLFKCFSCGHPSNIIGIAKKVLNCSGKEAVDFIKKKQVSYAHIAPSISSEVEIKNEQEQEEKIKKRIQDERYENLRLINFDPLEYFYTRSKGYTLDFVKAFNIKLCTFGRFTDFFITPLPEANSYEARKLKEYEVLNEFFPDTNLSLKELRSKYKDWSSSHEDIKNNVTYYLNKSKVLYPLGNMKTKPIIFNQSHLDFNDTLFICEGISGIPKIWTHLSKNVTATFGTELSYAQVKILEKFKKKIIIPDNDLASVKMIQTLCTNIDNIFVLNKKLEDDDEQYIPHIKSLLDSEEGVIEGSRFLIRYYNFLL